MDQDSKPGNQHGIDIARQVVEAFAKRGPRDPARIEEILTEIKKAWYSYPDLRFHQLLAAVQPERSGQDNFYLEDDVMLADLRKFNASPKI